MPVVHLHCLSQKHRDVPKVACYEMGFAIGTVSSQEAWVVSRPARLVYECKKKRRVLVMESERVPEFGMQGQTHLFEMWTIHSMIRNVIVDSRRQTDHPPD